MLLVSNYVEVKSSFNEVVQEAPVVIRKCKVKMDLNKCAAAEFSYHVRGLKCRQRNWWSRIPRDTQIFSACRDDM